MTLQWDPNSETDVAGYIVSYGTAPGQYGTTVDVGNQVAFQFTEPSAATVYYFVVRAYTSAGMESPLSAEVNTAALIPALTLTGINASVPAPQVAGTKVTFAAVASGGEAPIQYKWWIFDGTSWIVAQNWSTGSTFDWTPAVASSSYHVRVWVRGATSALDAPLAAAEILYPVTPQVQKLALTNLYANVPSPQGAGTSLKFTATASGGTAPYQFKWLVSLAGGAGWNVGQDWSASSTFTKTMTAGSYTVGVWVRSATNTTDAPENAGAGSSMPFVVTSARSVAVKNLKVNKPFPQTAGTRIAFTAIASGGQAGGAPLQYKWWIFNGATWNVAQGWSTKNTFIWTPTVANWSYQILVRVQDASNPADSAGVSMGYPIIGRRGR